jgi:glucan 1,6-alpha-glucosidase
MMNWWLDLGVSGFRLDVVDMLGKDWQHEQVVNGPHLHDYLHEMNRATFGRGDYLTVGEAWSAGPELARQYSDEVNQELSMIFQFGFTWADRVVGGEKWETKPLDVAQLKQALYDDQLAMADAGWPSLFWNNHDLPRAASRYGDGSPLAAKMLAIVLHGFRGTPFIYQGEELGMLNRPVTSIDEVDDVEARTIYRLRLAAGDTQTEALQKINVFNRDQARSPMQWDDTAQAGFTAGKPWLPVNDDYPKINVEQQVADPRSVFAIYQQLIQLRHTQAILQSGKFAIVSGIPDQVMAYTRSLNNVTWLIVANFSQKPMTVDLPVSQTKPIITNGLPFDATGTKRELQGYEAFIVAIKN